ncbi:MAG: RNA polymerase sigma-70 factor, ECF subfamily [Verrucomicrobia bacterium]|nr:MAG: RNA polymerase sigma-70 factor, ECF subfamily [Verrucomicrobiota bacterium]
MDLAIATNIVPPGDSDDAPLMEGIAAGDRTAFERLHRKFAGLVFATAYRVLNDPHDAEEVAQEVFSGVWNKSRLFDPKRGKPQVWLSTMARNRAIDRLRSKQRRAQLRDDLQMENNPETIRPDQGVVEEVRRTEESLVLRDALLRLKPEQREVIEMTYFKGLSQSQAAEVLGAPLGTVKARIRRGITRLRTIVSDLE